jgi:hypothetical protein
MLSTDDDPSLLRALQKRSIVSALQDACDRAE